MIDVEFASSAYVTWLLYYSPKEHENGHARAPDRVSATFFSRIRRDERERSRRSEGDEPAAVGRFKFRCRDRYAKIHREVIRGKRRERAR